MQTIRISPKQDFLERVFSATPINAVSELIWNGVDAGATRVDVTINTNDLGGVEEIVVRDNGSGIPAAKVETLFGGIGESWKRNTDRVDGRALHGKNGEGRFKAFALGSHAVWLTTFKTGESFVRYEIEGTASPCAFNYTIPKEDSGPTFTEVKILGVKAKGMGALCSESTLVEFAKIFAPYLTKNPSVSICVNGTILDPIDYFTVPFSQSLEDAVDEAGIHYPAVMDILDWKQSVERGMCLCDPSGIELHTIDPKLHAKGINYTIHVKCGLFPLLAKENRLILEELDPAVDSLIMQAKNHARSYFRRRKAEEQAGIVAQWKAEQIYPFEDKEDLSPIEIAERQVFDIIGVNVEDYLPSFDTADQAQKKFTFRLLAQAIATNPESLQSIISEVLGLKKEDQDALADLLKKTDLASVIKSAKTVSDRMNFLVGLQNLLFDKDTKASLLERDQLHKILEREAWIFDENFSLTLSEARLEEVLQTHLRLLGKRCDDDSPVVRENGNQGRVDLMFSLTNQPREGQIDHLVVELKRPSKKIDQEVISQIQSYAFAVAEDLRFDKTTTHWKFIVVSNEMDSFAEHQCHRRDNPVGRIFVDEDNRIEIWALTWTSIIHDAETRLQFINKQLKYSADRESSKAYLSSKYERYIPKLPVKE